MNLIAMTSFRWNMHRRVNYIITELRLEANRDRAFRLLSEAKERHPEWRIVSIREKALQELATEAQRLDMGY